MKQAGPEFFWEVLIVSVAIGSSLQRSDVVVNLSERAD